MDVELWRLERIIPYEKNARKIPQSAVDAVAHSLKAFGWQQPIVVDKKGVIVVGHARRLGAMQLGWNEAPVVIFEGSPAQARQYRLMDNRSHEEATWDPDLLKLELLDMKALNLDLALTGFSSRELDGFLRPAVANEDDAPPVPESAFTQPGDLWTMGEHRLLCGDCRNPGDVARVIGPVLPILMVTDPPYGVSLDMEWRDRAGHNEMGPANKSYMKIAMEGKGISGDTIADWSEAFALVPSLNVAYVWHATSHLVEVAKGLERIGFDIRQQIIWFKTVAAMSRSAYHWKHEPCWYAVRKGKTANWQGSKDQNTVWEAASPKHIMSGSKEEKLPHPTQKPVDLMRRPILNHTKAGQSVYEPFSGSGTTLAAAETSGRICYTIEIEPRFVDVAVRRWMNLTGKTAYNQDGVCFPNG